MIVEKRNDAIRRAHFDRLAIGGNELEIVEFAKRFMDDRRHRFQFFMAEEEVAVCVEFEQDRA